jgi:hypothetical protein
MVRRRLSCTSLVVVLVAYAFGARAEDVKPQSPFAHPSVAGSDVTLITLHDGRETLVLPWAELAEKRLESGPKSVTFTAEGEALFVPHCGGRKRVLVAGRDVSAPADGPLVVPLPKGRVDVSIDVVASKYERRVACAEAPRVGVPVNADAGFSTLKFTSPSAAKGGGLAVVYVPKNHDPKKLATVLLGVHPWNGGIWTYAQYMDLVREADKLDVVLLHPSGLGNSLYVAEAEAEVLRALAELERAMPVDPCEPGNSRSVSIARQESATRDVWSSASRARWSAAQRPRSPRNFPRASPSEAFGPRTSRPTAFASSVRAPPTRTSISRAKTTVSS